MRRHWSERLLFLLNRLRGRKLDVDGGWFEDGIDLLQVEAGSLHASLVAVRLLTERGQEESLLAERLVTVRGESLQVKRRLDEQTLQEKRARVER